MIRTSGDEAIDTRAIPRRVLVATDTSAASTGAEHAGVQLAMRAGASVIFLSVIDPSRLRLQARVSSVRTSTATRPVRRTRP